MTDFKEAIQDNDLSAAETPSSTIDPALAAQLGEFRQQVRASFAQVVMAMIDLPRYRHCALADLEHLVMAPLVRGCIVVVHARTRASVDPSPNDPVAGIAIWAKVSGEVDAKIREQIKTGVFPIRLKAEDWTSGEIAWLLDVLAPDQSSAAAVVDFFRKNLAEDKLSVHPVVGRWNTRQGDENQGTGHGPANGSATVPQGAPSGARTETDV